MKTLSEALCDSKVNAPSIQDKGMGCSQNVGLSDGSIEYVAECSEAGIAEVSLFVRDAAFSGLEDIESAIPDMCKGDDYEKVTGHTAMWH